MRELRVIGLEPSGTHLVCADSETGQKFRLPADDKLRAASRGDIARFGQIEIEMESTLRPKDIQARIRAGASVEQVAAESGMAASRVERFAYPVLLERSRAADLAQKGHPVRENGPAVMTLAEVVQLAFKARGHNFEQAEWDAWKDDDGHWVAQLTWKAGRSNNAAHWTFLPDAHGGTVRAMDKAATDLVDPDFGRPLRGLAPVPMATVVDGAAVDAPAADDTQHTLDDYYSSVPSNAPTTTEPERVEQSEPVTATGETAPRSSSSEAGESAAPKPAPAHQNSKDKRGKPSMPSWEDVLLGVRSSGH
ncbi:septation protein SepH [Antrihabitans cavernicola]|uniref:DUF3071 domain-containing protein n=1 Tax=Antrihabitans cavernicola TaxID=2495913 RepID=A0A5A7S6T0_9NOCA|nr:septation protein SepH [Spelaeibacter cavernicola]KAA0021204.1 DUF3071 domain-containing protein [Spelaeibacter cavernicola]